jgi:catechol 2,3-dioxygenase-like lactoylglutathione lyase family enzyme
MTTWADGIAAITLFTEDLAESKRFYQDIFELDWVFEDDNSCVFRIGATLINVLRVEAAHELIAPATVAAPAAGHRLVFTVGVEDVDALCERLAARGVKLLNGPMDRPWGIRTASFADPGGHIWEIAK